MGSHPKPLTATNGVVSWSNMKKKRVHYVKLFLSGGQNKRQGSKNVARAADPTPRPVDGTHKSRPGASFVLVLARHPSCIMNHAQFSLLQQTAAR